MAYIARNDRGQTDAALVGRFRQAVTKRDRVAVFDGVVREHRDAVLGRCAERLWPDADAAVGAARDVLIVAYLAMGDPAKLARPDRLRDWLLGLGARGDLASGLAAGIDAIDWGALQAGIRADVPDRPDMQGSAAASLRHWLEQIVATLPETRQQQYDLFVRRALDSRNAAMELGTAGAEARRLRRENRDAILRAFEITALAAAEAALDPLLDGETAGCGELRQILADAQRDGALPEGVRPDSLVLPADLRLAVARHVRECYTCRDRRDDCVAEWAPELLPILAGAELNEQVIDDLRTIPEPGRSRAWAAAGGHLFGSHAGHRGTAAVGTAKAGIPRLAFVAAGAGLLVVLVLLGFVRPGFLLSSTGSVTRGSSSSSSSSPKDPGSGSVVSSGDPQTGTSAGVPGRPTPSAAGSSSGGLSPGVGGSSAAPTSSSATPTQPGQSMGPPSSKSASPSPRPTSAPPPPTSPTPSPSAPQPTPSPTTPPPSPTTPPPTTSASPPPSPTPSTSPP